jgi:hypothetical protein
VTKFQEKNLGIYLSLSDVSVMRIEGKFIPALALLKEIETEAKKGNFSYELNLCKLERFTLALKMNDFNDVESELAYLSTNFERQRNLTEAFQANLLLIVLLIKQQKWIEAQGQLQELYESKLHDSAKNILLQIGLEFKDTFEKASRHLIEFEPLLDILNIVHEFEFKATDIRRSIKRQSNVIQFTNYQLSV